MASTVRTAVTLHKALFVQAESLAQQINISRSQLFGLAIANFIQNGPHPPRLTELDANPAAPTGGKPGLINQGDVYWVPLADADGSETGFTHPHVVIQENVFNRSRIHTVLVCALTSNLKRAKSPGNVLLEMGEANLPRQSVVEVSKVSCVDKSQLGEYIGALSGLRINQILAGMQFLQLITEPHEMGGEET